jgi:hypothetical protein
VLSYWVELSIRETDQNPSLASLSFLVDIWVLMLSKVEDNEAIGNAVLTAVNKVVKQSGDTTVQISCFALLFKLLLTFAELKSNYAPIIYKTLTF